MSLRIHHLNCGTLCTACERLITGRGNWLKPARMVCHCLLIATPEALVLVDTGFGSADIARPAARLGHAFTRLSQAVLDPAETAITQLRTLGYDPRDVRHVVPTHLDLDHAGGISDFPDAQVHVFMPELNAALNPTGLERLRYRRPQFAHGPRWRPHEIEGETWFGFQSIRAIPGLSTDVLLIPLVGHTRGHCGVAVRNGHKWLLHCGDAYFHRGTLKPEPDAPLAVTLFEQMMQMDAIQRLHNQARLRELAAKHSDEVEIFCAHDPVELERLTSA